MITISVCMIVKNEERLLRRCLESLKGLWDELIIVDTGSTDSTKAIAKEYTDKIFDFEWIGDFSAARNFCISKATCDYIYLPDADEILNKDNYNRFQLLKQVLDTNIEIVEMRYVNQLENGTIYNYDKEYRPKLYKRLREFTFIEPVHEMVRLDPVVFESDIDIIHMPEEVHTDRDIKIFEKTFRSQGYLSDRLSRMYARELMVSGDAEDFVGAREYFGSLVEKEDTDPELFRLAYIILAEAALTEGDVATLMKYSLKDVALGASSEMCSILGAYYENLGELEEACTWYFNAAYETEPELNIRYKNDIPLKALIRAYGELGLSDQAAIYEDEWTMRN